LSRFLVSDLEIQNDELLSLALALVDLLVEQLAAEQGISEIEECTGQGVELHRQSPSKINLKAGPNRTVLPVLSPLQSLGSTGDVTISLIYKEKIDIKCALSRSWSDRGT
jgi:hypothetical protein